MIVQYRLTAVFNNHRFAEFDVSFGVSVLKTRDGFSLLLVSHNFVFDVISFLSQEL